MAKRSAAAWAELVEGWRRSGVSGPAFAKRRRVAVEQLRWWKWHLEKRRGDRVSATSPTAMVRVEVGTEAAAAADARAIEVVRGGWVVRVHRGVHVETLVQVLDALAHIAPC